LLVQRIELFEERRFERSEVSIDDLEVGVDDDIVDEVLVENNILDKIGIEVRIDWHLDEIAVPIYFDVKFLFFLYFLFFNISINDTDIA
jgi:hypothetical protein